MAFPYYSSTQLNFIYNELTNNGHRPHPKIKFTPEEDERLKMIVEQFGEGDWVLVSQHMGNRNPRQCKERWQNYLSPKVCKDPWSPEEDAQLIKLHSELGSKWVKISRFFKNRTDNNIKNRWLVLQRQKKNMEMSKEYNETIKEQPETPKYVERTHETKHERKKPNNPLADNMFNFDHDNEVDLWSDMMSGLAMQTDIYEAWM